MIVRLLNISLFKQFFPIIVVIFLLSGLYLYNPLTNTVYSGKQCYFEGMTCNLNHNDKLITVDFLNDIIEVEEELMINIGYPLDYHLANAWVEGTNMFMGKINVELNDLNVSEERVINNGVLFLGSCSEPHMRWRLVLEFNVSGKSTPEKYYFNFQTDIE